MTAASLRTAIRLRSVLFGFGLAAVVMGTAHAQPGMPLPGKPLPPPPPDGATCPMEAIGQSGGMWYYITSDCATTTGFGQFATYYDSPQCSNGQCLVDPLAAVLPLSPSKMSPFQSALPMFASWQVGPAGQVGGPAGNQSNKAADNAQAEVEQTLQRMDQILANLNYSPKRKLRIQSLRPFVQKTLEYLKALDTEAPQKAQALQNFRTELSLHEKRWSVVPYSIGNRNGFLNDTKPDYVPVSAANTKFELAPGIASSTSVTVSVSRGPLLKLVQHNPGKPIYFQTFTVDITPRNGVAVIARFGVQAAPEPGEIGSSITVKFSERGNYAHKLFLERATAGIPGGTTFYLNSVDSLEP